MELFLPNAIIQLGELVVSARAELFLFSLAVVAHFVLFGNAFPQKTKGKKIDPPHAIKPISKRPHYTAPSSVPEQLEECEQCFQVAFDQCDYQTVLRCWNQLRKLDEVSSINLAHVVEAMQRLKKDDVYIFSEIRGFFKQYEERCDVANVNDFLEGLQKPLSADLAQRVVDTLPTLNVQPTERTYQILLTMHYDARHFRALRLVVADMESHNMPISAWVHLMLLKAALGLNDLAEALFQLREAQRVQAASGAASDNHETCIRAYILKITELACKLRQLPSFVSELDDLPVTTEAVTTMLAECERIRNFDLLDKIEKLARERHVPLNAKFYHVLLKASTYEHDRVLELFDEILSAGVEFSTELALTILSAAAQSYDFALVDRFVEHAKPTQIQVISALIRVYARGELHEKACDVWERHLRSQGSSEASALRLDARAELCLMNSLMKCGREAAASGFLKSQNANVAKHVAMIQECSQNGNLDGAMSIFQALEKMGAELTASIYNSVLDACVESKAMRRAQLWMKRIQSEGLADIISYNTMVKGYVRAHDFKGARTVMQDMASAGVSPNQVTYNELMHCMMQSGRHQMSQIWEIVVEMKDQRVAPNNVTCSILLQRLNSRSSQADITRTMSLLSETNEPMDEVLQSSVIEALVRVGKQDLLTAKLAEMQGNAGISITGSHTFGSLIKAYGIVKDIKSVWRCWKEMRSRRIRPTEITIGCMVEAIANNGDAEGAYELIHQIQDDGNADLVNAIAYCSVLKSFAHAKDMRRTWAVWEEMLQKRVEPSITTFNALLDACARNNAMDQVPQLMTDLKDRGLTPNLITYSTLVKGHCLRADVSSAFSVLEDMTRTTKLEPDEIMYNALIDGCAQAKLFDEGVRLLEQMQVKGIRPTNYTLSVLVKMGSLCRKLDWAFDIVKLLPEKHNFKPNTPVYGNLVQACVFNRDLPRAFSLLEQMVQKCVQPDIRTYAILSRACVRSGLYDKGALVLRAALALPGSESLPVGRGLAARGLDDLTNEVLGILADRGQAQDLAMPLLLDVRHHRPVTRIDASTQRKIAACLNLVK